MARYKQITLGKLFTMARAARGRLHHHYGHWTAAHYGQYFPDYHLLIDRNGELVATTDDLTDVLAHTYLRNTGSIGTAMCCAYGAVANDGYNADLGSEPPTEAQIEAMAQVMAVLAKALELPLTAFNFMTHQEAATLDGYGPYSGDPQTRWDLWFLPDSAHPLRTSTAQGAGGASGGSTAVQRYKLRPGGAVLLGKALWYYHLWFGTTAKFEAWKRQHGVETA